MVMFCSGAHSLDPLARRLLSDHEAALYDAAPNKFNFVELKLRRLAAKMGLSPDQVSARWGQGRPHGRLAVYWRRFTRWQRAGAHELG